MKFYALPAMLLLLPCLTLHADAPARLTVAPPDTARYDFGTRTCGDPSPLTHTFQLCNGGTLPLTLAPGASLSLG